MARKGVAQERLIQLLSVTTQVAISRSVSRFQAPELGDRQDAKTVSNRTTAVAVMAVLANPKTADV